MFSNVCKDIPVEPIFWFLLWTYWASQNPLCPLENCPIFLELNRRLIQCHILLSEFTFRIFRKLFLRKLQLQSRSTKTLKEVGMSLLYFVCLSCKSSNISMVIVTESSLLRKSWKDDDLSLYVILNAFSCIWFI